MFSRRRSGDARRRGESLLGWWTRATSPLERVPKIIDLGTAPGPAILHVAAARPGAAIAVSTRVDPVCSGSPPLLKLARESATSERVFAHRFRALRSGVRRHAAPAARVGARPIRIARVAPRRRIRAPRSGRRRLPCSARSTAQPVVALAKAVRRGPERALWGCRKPSGRRRSR
jgi:hypothetical protein